MAGATVSWCLVRLAWLRSQLEGAASQFTVMDNEELGAAHFRIHDGDDAQRAGAGGRRTNQRADPVVLMYRAATKVFKLV